MKESSLEASSWIELIKHYSNFMFRKIPKFFDEREIETVGTRAFITINFLHHQFDLQ
jgi:hypothetical protein